MHRTSKEPMTVADVIGWGAMILMVVAVAAYAVLATAPASAGAKSAKDDILFGKGFTPAPPPIGEPQTTPPALVTCSVNPSPPLTGDVPKLPPLTPTTTSKCTPVPPAPAPLVSLAQLAAPQPHRWDVVLDRVEVYKEAGYSSGYVDFRLAGAARDRADALVASRGTDTRRFDVYGGYELTLKQAKVLFDDNVRMRLGLLNDGHMPESVIVRVYAYPWPTPAAQATVPENRGTVSVDPDMSNS